PGENCRGEHKVYTPAPIVAGTENSGHGGGDFFTTYYFIRSILGDEEAHERAIGVYDAVDMCIPGTLGYRSIVMGNQPIKIPNLRNPEERDAWRRDTFCTFPESAGDMLVSNNVHEQIDIPDEVFDEVRRRWEAGEPG
ncbi:MAG: hypothetical protein II557_12670, partial [Clostridia bacterium]|nr:hypothetical protein [Clostridia bacterium]